MGICLRGLIGHIYTIDPSTVVNYCAFSIKKQAKQNKKITLTVFSLVRLEEENFHDPDGIENKK